MLNPLRENSSACRTHPRWYGRTEVCGASVVNRSSSGKGSGVVCAGIELIAQIEQI